MTSEESRLVAEAKVAFRRVENGCPDLPPYTRRGVVRLADALEINEIRAELRRPERGGLQKVVG